MMQFRTLNPTLANVKIEKREDGSRVISGYAAVFYREGQAGTEFQLFRDLYERVLPGAFTDAIANDDVRALLNHDPNMLLARNGRSGRLALKEDERGLYYEFPVDEKDPDHLRVIAKLERGDLSGSSFGFEPVVRRFVEFKDYDVIELVKVRLYDVSPATFPAYEGTTVGIRSSDGLDTLQKEHRSWKETIQNERKAKSDLELLQLQQIKANAGIL